MSIEDDFAEFRRVAGEEIAKLREENASLRAHAERVGQANDRLAVDNDELRKDKERLDYIFWPSCSRKARARMLKLIGTPGYRDDQGGMLAWRVAIDDARKEAQQ